MTTETIEWTAVCAIDNILPDTGVCALVDNQHVAVFRVGQNQFMQSTTSIRNPTPACCHAGLLAAWEIVVVASPLYKNHYLTCTRCGVDDWKTPLIRCGPCGAGSGPRVDSVALPAKRFLYSFNKGKIWLIWLLPSLSPKWSTPVNPSC